MREFLLYSNHYATEQPTVRIKLDCTLNKSILVWWYRLSPALSILVAHADVHLHSDPEIRRGRAVSKTFFWFLRPRFGPKRRRAAPPGPSPRSATASTNEQLLI